MKSIFLIVMVLFTISFADTPTKVFGDVAIFTIEDDFNATKSDAIIMMDRSNPRRDRMIAFSKYPSGNMRTVLFQQKYLGGDRDNDVLVRFRVDENTASEQKYARLARGKRMTHVSQLITPDILRQMKEGNILRVEIIDPFDGERLVMTFSLRGFTAAHSYLFN